MTNEAVDPTTLDRHVYTVELRFWGGALVPREISQRLSLEPSIVQEFSGIRGGRLMKPLWGFNGSGEDGFQSQWASLDHGLKFLLKRLMPLRETIIDISKATNAVWWCGHFQTSFDGGPTLSPEVLFELAKYQIPLFLDNYHGEP